MTVSIPILMYHSIASDASPAFRRWTVGPERFDAHMRCLRDEGFTPLTVGELVRRRGGAEAIAERPVIVTFDDGFADFLSGAVPVLVRQAIPATLYVCTGYLGYTSRWLHREGEGDRRMLSHAEVRSLPEAGIECGAHTRTHPQLDTLRQPNLAAEISGSKADLEDILGAPVSTFAYPHGYHSRSVVAHVRAAGYSSACAVKHAMSSDEDDTFSLARIIVEADTDIPSLRSLLRGEGLRVAPFRDGIRTSGWRLVRRSRARLGRSMEASA